MLGACRECGKIYTKETREQEYCDRRCARIAQARKGEPSQEDREARFVDEVLKLARQCFRAK